MSAFAKFLRAVPTAFVVSVLGVVSAAQAGPICPDSSYVVVDYACRFTGSYHTGEPKNIVTVSPVGYGETFDENGISIRVYLRDCQGRPVVGVPAESVSLTRDYLCTCPGGNHADGPSDENGCSMFSGELKAGGCVVSLDVMAEGQLIDTIPVGTNSPDDPFQYPCHIDQGELVLLGSHILNRWYEFCWDFNEDGILDALDYAEFVSRYYGGRGCLPAAALDASGGRESDPAVRDAPTSPVSPATEPPVTIGLFFDPEGTVCSGEIHEGDGGELWVVAHVMDNHGPPIVGAEFHFGGLTGHGWIIDPWPPRGQRIFTPFYGDVLLAFWDPQPVDQGFVILARVEYAATSEIPETVVRIEGSTTPSNPSFTGPVVIVQDNSLDCGRSRLGVVPAVGLEAVINGKCVVGVAGKTWTQVKDLYR